MKKLIIIGAGGMGRTLYRPYLIKIFPYHINLLAGFPNTVDSFSTLRVTKLQAPI